MPEWIDSGHETIEGIRLIKRELPGVSTILGVSNVSFGLTPEARAVLNSVFLHHCVAGRPRRGDRQSRPHHAVRRDFREERELADDLVFNKSPGRSPALHRVLRQSTAEQARQPRPRRKIRPRG